MTTVRKITAYFKPKDTKVSPGTHTQPDVTRNPASIPNEPVDVSPDRIMNSEPSTDVQKPDMLLEMPSQNITESSPESSPRPMMPSQLNQELTRSKSEPINSNMVLPNPELSPSLSMSTT